MPAENSRSAPTTPTKPAPPSSNNNPRPARAGLLVSARSPLGSDVLSCRQPRHRKVDWNTEADGATCASEFGSVSAHSIKGRLQMSDKPVALITGANRGIGFQISKDLASHGFTVLVGARNLVHGESAAASIDGDAHGLQLDVTDQASID